MSFLFPSVPQECGFISFSAETVVPSVTGWTELSRQPLPLGNSSLTPYPAQYLFSARNSRDGTRSQKKQF